MFWVRLTLRLLMLSPMACGGEQAMLEGATGRDSGAPFDAGHDAGAAAGAGQLDASVTDAGASLDAGAVDGGSPRPTGCVTSVLAGHHTFTCAGFRFDVEVPSACALGGCGLVLDLHGLTMDAAQLDRSTGLRALAAPNRMIVAQPTAAASVLGPSWNPATDDDKVWAAVGALRSAYAVDARRVHVTGFSQGGAMTFRLLCAHGDEIASAAPVAAADAASLDSNVAPFRLDCPFDTTRSPSRPLSVLQMHGTKDGLVPIAKGREQRDAVLSWLGAATQSVVTASASHRHTRYTSASKRVVFEYLEHDWEITRPLLPLVRVAGHCYPGGDDQGPSAGHQLYFSCAPPNAFDWGALVMNFFTENPRAE